MEFGMVKEKNRQQPQVAVSSASWKTIFTSLVEQELSENNLLSTIARLDKEWRVTVELLGGV